MQAPTRWNELHWSTVEPLVADVRRGPFDPGGQPPMDSPSAMQVSLFGWNIRMALTATKAVLVDPDRYRDYWRWSSSKQLLLAAERAGFDSQVQFGQWSGYGGATGWCGASLDFASASAASATVTSRLGLVSTIHVSFDFNPLLIAKITATLDHISGGRLGVNLVAGADPVDYAQFGFEGMRTPAERYDIADEFTILLKYLWTSDRPVTFEGDYFTVRGAQVDPQPTSQPRPFLMNAASSEIGIDYACRQCDAIFISPPEQELTSVKETADRIHATAARYGRRIRICLMCYVVMDESDAKAAETVAWLEDEVDVAAITNQYWRLKSVYNPSTEEIDEDPYLGLGEEWFRRKGLGMGGYQLFGSHETVAGKIKELHDAGVEQVALCFWDPQRDVQAFGEHVMPYLRTDGIHT